MATAGSELARAMTPGVHPGAPCSKRCGSMEGSAGAALMTYMTRRTFLAAGIAITANRNRILAAARGSGNVDDTLRSGIERRKIPAVVAMAASDRKTLYTGAFGVRDASGAA